MLYAKETIPMVESLSKPATAGITILIPPTWVGWLLGGEADRFRRLVILGVLAVMLFHGYPGAA